MSTFDIEKRINEIFFIRGNIAHTGFTEKNLTFDGNFKYMEFLYDIAQQTEEIVNEHISSLN